MRGNKTQLIIVLLIVIAIPLTVLAAQITFDLNSSADTGSIPSEVIVANVTEASASVCWYTTEPRTGIVNFGTTEASMPTVAKDDRDLNSTGEYNNHCARLRNLAANTTYFFQITSGSEVYKSDGAQNFTFKTLTSTDALATPDTIVGTITPPPTEGVLYAHASNGTQISTPIAVLLTSGNYAFSKSNFRDKTTGEVFDLDASDIIIAITNAEGQRGSRQVSSSATRADGISLSASGSKYNPNLVFAVVTVTPTATVAPTPSGPVTPTPTLAPATVNTAQLLTSKVSFGDENNNPTIPFSIFLSNIGTTNLCVNWLTKEPTLGTLLYRRGSTGVEKLGIDERDSAVTQVKRYTHKVCIFEADLKKDDRIGFYLVSNNKKYGQNLGAAESDRFIFAMPGVTSSPPSPGSIQGTLTKTYASISKEPRDVLISARHQTAAGNSTWVSSIPTTAGTNWTLDYNSILKTTIDGFFDPTASGNQYHIDVNGEFNSVQSRNVTTAEDVVAMTLDAGLAVLNVNHEGNLGSNGNLSGTSLPNSDVTVTINNKSFNATADANGLWSVNVSALSSGNQRLNSISGDGRTLNMEVNVVGGTLPPTAIENYNSIIIGLVLLVIGIVLKKQIENRKLEY